MFKAIQHAAIPLTCPIGRFDALPTRYIALTNLAAPARSLPCLLRVADARPSFTIHCCTRRGAIYNFTSLCLRLPLHGASPRYAGADSTQNDAPLYHGNLVNRFALQNLNHALLFIAVNLLCFATPSLPSLGRAWVSNAHAIYQTPNRSTRASLNFTGPHHHVATCAFNVVSCLVKPLQG